MVTMKALVAYYSRTGRTKDATETIANSLKADIEEISEGSSRRGIFGFLKSGREGALKKTPRIKKPLKDIIDYDIAIIGMPIWAGKMASPVRSYVKTYGKEAKQIALFCTHCGGGGDPALSEIEHIMGKKAIAKIELTTNDTSKINEFSDFVQKTYKSSK